MSLTLTPEEIAQLVGGLTLPRCQVRRLREQGFVRARVERGKAVLERAHYEAVCRGEYVAVPGLKSDTPRPVLRSLKAVA